MKRQTLQNAPAPNEAKLGKPHPTPAFITLYERIATRASPWTRSGTGDNIFTKVNMTKEGPMRSAEKNTRSTTRNNAAVRPAPKSSPVPRNGAKTSPAERQRVLTDTATIFRAFSDETRLRILNLLLEGEVCVCDLCDVLDVLQPSISRHLAYLDRAGLVTVRESGRWKYYRAVRPTDATRRRLLATLKAGVRDLAILTRDLDKLRRLQQQPGHCC